VGWGSRTIETQICQEEDRGYDSTARRPPTTSNKFDGTALQRAETRQAKKTTKGRDHQIRLAATTGGKSYRPATGPKTYRNATDTKRVAPGEGDGRGITSAHKRTPPPPNCNDRFRSKKESWHRAISRNQQTKIAIQKFLWGGVQVTTSTRTPIRSKIGTERRDWGSYTRH